MRPTLELVALFSLRPHKEVDQVEEKKRFFYDFCFWFYRLSGVQQFHRSADLAARPSSLSILKPKPIKIRLAEKKEVKRNEVDHLSSIQSRVF